MDSDERLCQTEIFEDAHDQLDHFASQIAIPFSRHDSLTPGCCHGLMMMVKSK
jgi:hypothetical protein